MTEKEFIRAAHSAKLYTLYPDTDAILDAWISLMRRYKVTGKAHDARLVAAMQVHGIQKIFTFNTKDFKRYEEIEIVEPQNLLD